LIFYRISVSIYIMKFQKIPFYLRYSIEQIVADARKNITVHYIHNMVHSVGKGSSRAGTWCQIIDHTDYSQYFYEPKKFEMLENRTIRSIDQRSAHQNAIIALKKWESEVIDFLSNPGRILDIPSKTHKESTSSDQIRVVVKSSSRLQKPLRARERQIDTVHLQK
jgi:hypothetical protein